MANQILAISIKSGEVSVQSKKLLTQSTSRDSVYPGRNSDPVPPSPDFANALIELTDALVDECSLSEDYDWVLLSVTFVWDEEGESYGFKTVLTGYKAKAPTVKVTIEQKSPSYALAKIKLRLGQVESEAIKFIGGASAQGNLLEMGSFDQAVGA